MLIFNENQSGHLIRDGGTYLRHQVFFCISLPLARAMDLLVCVADVWEPGIRRLWPDISFGIHLPRRKKAIETFLEVADQTRESNP